MTGRFQRNAAIVGVAGLALAGLGAAVRGGSDASGFTEGVAQFFRSYLVAYLLVMGPAVGSLVVLMIHHLTGGEWGDLIRPALETAARTLPVVALLFVPLAFGLSAVYPWARWGPAELEGSHHLSEKALYLNPTGFVVRAAVYLVVWNGMAWLLTRRGETAGNYAGGGMILFAVVMTLAAVDWVMSLEPLWYSTIFGMLVASGVVLASFSFAVLAMLVEPGHPAVAPPKQGLQDLGNLMLTMVMIWAYLGFSQFLLIYAGNLPEEIPYYLRRLGGGWQWVALAMVFFRFVLPFFLLLSVDLKRNRKSLAVLAGLIFLSGILEAYWNVVPAYFPYQAITLDWMDVAVVVGLGGLWLALFARGLDARRSRPETPENLEVERG